MSQERTEAVVLRGVDFSETSRVVTFLSPDRGRLACLAKGVRRKNSPMAGALDTMNRLELIYYWKDGRAVQTLGEATVLETYAAIKSDLAKASYAAFPVEVAMNIAHENEPSFTLYAALALGLDSLAAWRGDVRTHASWQVLQLLNAAGFEPSMECCVDCGRPVSGAPGFAWRGGVTCAACPADVRLAAEQYACLRGMVANRDACPDSGNGADDYSRVSAAVFRVVRQYAARQLETDFRSVRVIDQLFLEKG